MNTALKHVDADSNNDQALIRAGALQGYTALLNDLDVDPQQLLDSVGLSLSILEDTEAGIAFSAMESLLELSAAKLGIADFGLRLARYQDFSMLGSVGLLITRSRTILEAVQCARNYLSLHVRAEYWEVRSEGELCFITRYQYQRQQASKGQNAELSMGVCFQLLKQLIGPDFQAYAIHFSHQALSSDSLYTRYFETQVQFSQEKDQLIFSRAYLKRQIATNAPEIQRNLRHELDKQLSRYDGDIERQVCSLILANLGSQDSMLENIADLLHLHPRTLQRRLEAKGKRFKTLLQDLRMESARWVLSNSQMPLTQLSQMLGYTSPSAFSKAFRLVHDLSPRAWRKALR